MTTAATNLIEVPKYIEEPAKQIQKTIKSTVKWGKIFYGVKDDVFDESISKSDKVWTGIKPLLPGIGLITDIPKFINNVYAAMEVDKTMDKAYHATKAVLGGLGIVQVGTSIIEGAKFFGWIAKDALPWTPVVSLALFPLQILGLESAVSTIYQGFKAKEMMEQELPKSKKTDSPQDRFTNLTKSCRYIIDNKKEVGKLLSISKEAGISDKAKKILSDLASENNDTRIKALEEGEAMMKILRTRVDTKIGIGIGAIAVKVTALVASGILLFALPTPAAPAILGAVAVLSLSFWAFEKIMLNGDPLSKPKDVWHEQIPHQIRESVHGAAKEVRKFAQQMGYYGDNFVRNMQREIENLGKQAKEVPCFNL